LPLIDERELAEWIEALFSFWCGCNGQLTEALVAHQRIDAFLLTIFPVVLSRRCSEVAGLCPLHGSCRSAASAPEPPNAQTQATLCCGIVPLQVSRLSGAA